MTYYDQNLLLDLSQLAGYNTVSLKLRGAEDRYTVSHPSDDPARSVVALDAPATPMKIAIDDWPTDRSARSFR
ncbi:MAG: hypothetical protein IT445_12660 [Phycisphaeraceae bacterium]|nr:hypothetical protein [Phycisphaeraceae bacterium]